MGRLGQPAKEGPLLPGCGHMAGPPPPLEMLGEAPSLCPLRTPLSILLDLSPIQDLEQVLLIPFFVSGSRGVS